MWKTDSLSETAFDTARREAEEEIGLPREGSKIPAPFKVDHLCELPSNLAKSELVVRPCVALLHAGRKANSKGGDVEDNLIPSLDAREVAAVFSAPFHNFLLTKDEVPRRVRGSDSISDPGLWYQGYWTEFFGSRWRMHSFHVPIVGQKVTKPKPSVNERKVEAKPEQIAQDNVFTQDGFRVFGMTARILVDAARIAYGQEPEFEHNSHFGDEELIKQLMAAGRLQDKKGAKDDTLKEDSAKDAKI
ncbi:MAG: hypothetical protein M1825_002824 [Sarcosagium campestre]|nr:MAG: hypothetical protein M1825_002824 [Sarcosagium campestre]